MTLLDVNRNDVGKKDIGEVSGISNRQISKLKDRQRAYVMLQTLTDLAKPSHFSFPHNCVVSQRC